MSDQWPASSTMQRTSLFLRGTGGELIAFNKIDYVTGPAVGGGSGPKLFTSDSNAEFGAGFNMASCHAEWLSTLGGVPLISRGSPFSSSYE